MGNLSVLDIGLGIDVHGASHTTNKEAHTKDIGEILATGNYHGFHGDLSDGSAFALSANVLYSIPIVVARNITVDRIAVEVTATGVSANARLGIYNNGTNLAPGTLLLDAGTVSGATTGVKAITISQALTKGIYHLALVADVGFSVVRRTTYGSNLGIAAAAFGQSIAGQQAAFTYAALPTPFPSSTNTNNITIGILLRLLSLD